MRVLVLGASGIIGQHMQLAQPRGIDAIFHRRKYSPFDLDCAVGAICARLDGWGPTGIVNLAGENRPDIVEQNLDRYHWLNVCVPSILAGWCLKNRATLVHVSSQAALSDVNAYGRQKAHVENVLKDIVCIARPTFVLGVRPFPEFGRENPVEQMLAGQRRQVNDRWFSPSFASDVAARLWELVQRPRVGITNLGIPMRTTRYEIARAVGVDAIPVSHDDFPGLAPRPIDTSYSEAEHTLSFEEGLELCRARHLMTT